MKHSAASRMTVGFIAAALAVVLFEQAMCGLLHTLQLRYLEMPDEAYDLTVTAPLGVPAVVLHCLNYGAIGILFGLVAPGLSRPSWLPGLMMGGLVGLISVLVLPRMAFWSQYGVSGPVPEDWPALFILALVWGFCAGALFDILSPPERL